MRKAERRKWRENYATWSVPLLMNAERGQAGKVRRLGQIQIGLNVNKNFIMECVWVECGGETGGGEICYQEKTG